MTNEFEEEFTPPTQPFGALVPPPKGPRTALATASPAPLPPRPSTRRTLRDRDTLQYFISRTLDVVDSVADTIAEGIGLRRA